MRCAILLVLFGGLTIGCKQNPYVEANIELMNAERRALEDRLYELEYQYETKVEEVEELREANARLLATETGSGSRRDTSPSRPRLRVDPPRNERPSEPSFQVPRIELPDPVDEAAADPSPAPPAPRADRAVLDRQITRVELKRRSLKGVDFDEQPGDDGLAILIQPRNEANEVVSQPGPITVVVLDTAYEGLEAASEKGRVARWDLSTEDVRRFVQTAPNDKGIQLHLLWPEHPPEHEKLRVHVRYHTEDGRQLDTQAELWISLTPQLSQRWTPRAMPSPDAIADQPPETPPVHPKTMTPPATGGNEEPIAIPEWTPYR